MTTLNTATSSPKTSETNKNIPPIIKNELKKEKELYPLYLEKINEGEKIIPPHQKNDIKPEEINESVQAPPEEYISPEKKNEADIYTRTQNAIKELRKEEKRLAEVRATRLKIEEKLKNLQNIILSPQKSSNPPSSKNPNTLMAMFLQKLSFFRKEANKKRAENKQINLEKIIELSKNNSRITNNDVEKITGVGHQQAWRYLNILRKRKKLVRHGRGKATYYTTI